MKLISTCEKQFISNCIIKRQKRLDGRQLLQGRTLDIIFGKERGCCMVLLGNTRILAQVSCEVSEPKESTPTEGTLHINFELSSMAHPDAKSQLRSSEESVEAQRSLERCIRDSKALDLESLCIITGSKVWTIRVDVHALNDDGNLVEAASVAAIASLAHFRRPEVTVVGTDVTVHSIEEKEPVALNLHHMPISINLALFDQGKYILVDPTDSEEKICDGCYIIGMNAHQEMCFVHRRGVLLLKAESVKRCEEVAVKRAQEVTQIIRAALDDDAYKRATNATIGFVNLVITDTLLGARRPMAEVDLESVKSMQNGAEPDVVTLTEDNGAVEDSGKSGRTVNISHIRSSAIKAKAMNIIGREQTVFEGGPSKWGEEMEDEESNSDDDNSQSERTDVKPEPAVKEEISIDSEEEAAFMFKDQLDVNKPSSRGWYAKDPFQ